MHSYNSITNSAFARLQADVARLQADVARLQADVARLQAENQRTANEQVAAVVSIRYHHHPGHSPSHQATF